MKLSVTIFAIVILLGACSFSKPTIKIKAAIVYTMGGAQPVARTTFYLTKDDLLTLSRQAGKKPDIGYWGLQCEYDTQVSGKPSNLERLVAPHAVSTVTTDFEGNGAFENITANKYYLIGATQTRKGVAIWSLPVNTGDETILLDQNNAAYVSP